MSPPEAEINAPRTSSSDERSRREQKPYDSAQASLPTTTDLSHRDQDSCGGGGHDEAVTGTRDGSSDTGQSTEPIESRTSKSAVGVDDKPKEPLRKNHGLQNSTVEPENLEFDLESESESEAPEPSTLPPRTTSKSAATFNTSSAKAPPADAAEGSGSEIQNIMDQFDNAPPDEESDHLSGPLLGNSIQHPPRKSSLEPKSSSNLPSVDIPRDRVVLAALQSNILPDVKDLKISSPVESTRRPTVPQPTPFGASAPHTPSSPNSSLTIRKPLPPEPDPEPDLPFDFHRFLDQLRHRTADPVAKFLRSFLLEFGKKQWMVHEQVKLIRDFLAFIANKMTQCEVWRGVSDAEFDNAKEGMEKLVMNRLYSQTFSPAIPSSVQTPGIKGKRKNLEKLLGPGRRGQHQEDIERDEILGQKVRIYGWVQEEHLDIPTVGNSGRRFLTLAQQELIKINTYRAPRDKVICVLNCCKVIFGLLRNSKAADTSADSFVPLLIYVVLHANPEHLVSNVQYILRFRNQDKLGGEAGYYLSSLMGVVQFIENLDRTSLTVSDADFERNVEAAVFAIAERHKEEETPQSIRHSVSEKSGLSEPEMAPRDSVEAGYVKPVRPGSSRVGDPTGDGSDESTAVNGLLRTIQKPLSSIGRIFSEDVPKVQNLGQSGLPDTNTQPVPSPQLSPSVFQPPRNSNDLSRPLESLRGSEAVRYGQKNRLTADANAARQASAEAAEAEQIQRAEHEDVIETLSGIFPDLDRDIIDDVVRVKQGRVGAAVDACLALST